jgi:hypothetical protein
MNGEAAAKLIGELVFECFMGAAETWRKLEQDLRELVGGGAVAVAVVDAVRHSLRKEYQVDSTQVCAYMRTPARVCVVSICVCVCCVCVCVCGFAILLPSSTDSVLTRPRVPRALTRGGRKSPPRGGSCLETARDIRLADADQRPSG